MIIFIDDGGGGGGGGGTPVYESVATTESAADVTSLVCNMPSGIAAGNVLVAIVTADGTQTINASAGWTALTANQTISGGGATARAFWKVAAGSDALTVSVGSAERIAVVVARASSASNAQAAFATGGSTPAAPPTINPSGGTRNYLFLVGIAFASSSANPSADPSGYTQIANVVTTGGTAGQSVRQYAARRDATSVSSESPGTAAYANATQWGAYTIAVW